MKAYWPSFGLVHTWMLENIGKIILNIVKRIFGTMGLQLLPLLFIFCNNVWNMKSYPIGGNGES